MPKDLARVKRTNLDRLRRDLDDDAASGISEEERRQREMAYWLNTGTTWRGPGDPPR